MKTHGENDLYVGMVYTDELHSGVSEKDVLHGGRGSRSGPWGSSVQSCPVLSQKQLIVWHWILWRTKVARMVTNTTLCTVSSLALQDNMLALS